MDWDKVQRPVFSINVRDELTDHALEFRRIGQCRARHLYHHDIAHPFWVVVQQLLKGAQLQ